MEPPTVTPTVKVRLLLKWLIPTMLLAFLTQLLSYSNGMYCYQHAVSFLHV